MSRVWVHDKPKYGGDTSYAIGMDWLAGCQSVEDWGCSLQYAKRFCKPAYVGVDGTAADGFDIKVRDLSAYVTKTPGLFMRHVLEHNASWRQVLSNALESFTERMALITFTDFAETEQVAEHKPHKRPDWDHLRLPEQELMQTLAPFVHSVTKLEPDAGQNRKFHEHIFLLQKWPTTPS